MTSNVHGKARILVKLNNYFILVYNNIERLNILMYTECTLIRTIFGRDENAYKPKRLCRRVPLSVRCTLLRTIFDRAEVYG
jgi:hypothetical protein